MRLRSVKPLPAQSAPAQPSSTNSASSVRLPPEIIAHIQALAEEDQTPTEIKKLRATFELVDKEW